MKKLFLYIVAGFALSLGLNSCGEDYLNVDHNALVTPDVLLTSQEYVEQGLNGVYDLLYPERTGGDITQGWLLKPHMAMSNYPALDIQPDGWDVAFSRQMWTSGQAEFEGGWTRAYQSIDRANRFLANLADADPTIFTDGENTMKIIEAQARAIRAYFYTWLVQNFGGVPMLMTGDTYSTSPGKERGTAKEAWDLIVEDLEYARDVLDWDPWQNQKGRVTKGMAKAYLAQAYMYLANLEDRSGWFNKAKKELKDIIDSGKYSLNPCFGQIHTPGIYWQSESIWEISFPEWESMGWGREAYTDAVWWPVQLKGAKEYGGWGPHYVSHEFTWSFEPGDKRYNYEVSKYGEFNEFVKQFGDYDAELFSPPIYVEWMGVMYQIGGGYGPNFGLLGMNPSSRASIIGADNCPNNADKKHWRSLAGYKGREYDPLSAIQMRLAAIYLNYAECCFETGDEGTGWEYIQKIRDRAWGALEPNAPKTRGGLYPDWPFPFTLNEDAGLKAPDAKTFYESYKRSPGTIGGPIKKLVGSVDQYTPIYEDSQYISTYNYAPYTSPAWKVALAIERRHEFFAEYSLWYDLCRTGMAKEYLDAEYPKNNETYRTQPIPGVDTDLYFENPHTIRSYDHQTSRELYPIPYAEIMKNPALTEADQNPGY